MPAPFAALESRVNDVVIERLANVEASFTPAGGGAVVLVSGIFDDAYEVVVEGLVQSSGPAFVCRAADVPDAMRAGLVVRGTAYQVVEPMPDGTGMTVLRLREA